MWIILAVAQTSGVQTVQTRVWDSVSTSDTNVCVGTSALRKQIYIKEAMMVGKQNLAEMAKPQWEMSLGNSQNSCNFCRL